MDGGGSGAAPALSRWWGAAGVTPVPLHPHVSSSCPGPAREAGNTGCGWGRRAPGEYRRGAVQSLRSPAERGPKGSITVPAWDSHLAHPCRVTLAEKGQPERRAFR